jgi:putative transposase
MRKARWLAPWKDSQERPVIYHCITRVVERRFAFGKEEKEQFRTYMRMYDLGEFMKTFLLRFSRWFNIQHKRTGALWESRYKSVLVQEGVASQTIAAHIDLNPVRAGMVADPADYRWSSYGEAMGSGTKGNGAKARAGLVRAYLAHQGASADARLWAEKVAREYRMLLLEDGQEKLKDVVNAEGKSETKVVKKGMKKAAARAELQSLQRGQGLALGKMLRCRVRYFTDGAVIGSREFVDEAFRHVRERFGPKRKDGARKFRGAGSGAAALLWSARDLRKEIA